MKVGDRVKTTWQYSRDLGSERGFSGVIVEDVGNGVVYVCSKERGRESISKDWLELDEPCCKCCKCCRVEPVEVYEYQILSVTKRGFYSLTGARYKSVAAYLDVEGFTPNNTGHELFLPSKKLCK